MVSLIRFAPAVLIFIHSMAAEPQSNLSPGYVVTTMGDTLRGTINYLMWNESPDRVEFRGQEGILFYEPEDLIAFGVGDEVVYRSFLIRHDTTGTSSGRDKRSQPTLREAHALLRLIVDGHHDLLMFIRNDRKYFFIHEPGKVPQELISHYYIVMVGFDEKVQIGNQYIGQLRGAMRDCQIEILDDLGYRRESLAKVFMDYGLCKDRHAREFRKDPVRYSKGVFTAGSFDKGMPEHKGGVGFVAGADFRIQIPHLLYKHSIALEAAFHQFGHQRFQGRVIYNGNIPGGLQDADLDASAVRIAVIWRNRIAFHPIAPYLGLGGGFTRFGKGSYSAGGASSDADLVKTRCVVVCAGFTPLKLVTIEARYLLSSTVTLVGLPSANERINSFQLGFRVNL